MTDMPISDDEFRDLRNRVTAMEREVVDVRQVQAVREETLGSVDKRLTRIETNTSRLLWGVGSLVVAAIVGFIIRGGLSGPLPPIV